MPTAWFGPVPYKRKLYGKEMRTRYCALDDLTSDIRAAGGDWSETEQDGDEAIVFVRATSAMLDSIALLYPRLSETQARAAWRPTRSKPGWDAVDQRIIFQPAKPQACKPLDQLVVEVPTIGLSGELLALIGLWSAVGFGQGWRLPWDIILQGALSGYPPILGGAFPTASVLDVFTGTDGVDLPVYSANWAKLNSAQNDLEINTNGARAIATGNNSNDYWTVSNFGPGSEVFATYPVKPANGGFTSLALRIQEEGGSNTWDGYIVNMDPVAGTDAPNIARVDNSAGTVLTPAFSQEFAAGDAIGLNMIGSTLQAYRRPSGGSWAMMDTTRSDTTYALAGKIGFQWYEETLTGRWDDFGGGESIIFVPAINEMRLGNVMIGRRYI